MLIKELIENKATDASARVVFSFANGDSVASEVIDENDFIESLKQLVRGKILGAASHPDLMNHANDKEVLAFLDKMKTTGHITITFAPE